MQPILVTGGAGFIGSHVCKALALRGFLPVAYDNLSSGHADAVRWGPFEQGDVSDRRQLDDVLARWRPAAVMHFAAFAYVGESVRDPSRYYANNVAACLVLLDAMRQAGVNHIVFSSSCATYGIPPALPIDETMEQRPVNPYGRSKLMVEQILADYAAAYGLRFAALRYFNAAGADPEGELGERHEPETHLIPRVLMAAFGKIASFEIFGADYPTPDGTCIRDFVHVSDLAEAHIRTLVALVEAGENLSLNLGSGTGHSVREIIECAERLLQRRVPVTVQPRRPGDPPILVADASLARRRIGFSPRHSSLDSIITTAAPFFA
jgi:UDP-arabinose 4-epimerase